MKHVGIKQARQELPDLVDRAEAGEEIVITRQGRPVAKITAMPRSPRALPSLAQFRQALRGNGTPAVELLRRERDGH